MTKSTCAVALAVRVHAGSGAARNDAETVERLRAAAVSIGEETPGILAGPSDTTPGAVLILPLTSPEAILSAILSIAERLRPGKTTFAASVVALDEASPGGSEETVEATLLASDRAATTAASSIGETDARESRVLVLAPGRDGVLDALLDLIVEAYDAMTERQRQIISLVRNSDTQQQVAQHLSISRQAVNQSIMAAGWPHLRLAEEAVARRLGSLPL
jgi:DNA-binding NarL/FixJ family response regulator